MTPSLPAKSGHTPAAAYRAFIMGRQPHSWLVRTYAPIIAVRGYVAAWNVTRGSWRNPWTSRRRSRRSAHATAIDNARARFLLAWNGTPTCGLPLPLETRP